MLVAIAATWDRQALVPGKLELAEGAKPVARLAQVAFTVYKVSKVARTQNLSQWYPERTSEN